MRLKTIKDYKKSRDSHAGIRVGGVSVSKSHAIAVLVLLMGNVLFAIDTSSKGASLAAIETELSLLKAENRGIKTKILAESSLLSLSEQANDLGLVVPDRIVYIKSPKPIARIP